MLHRRCVCLPLIGFYEAATVDWKCQLQQTELYSKVIYQVDFGDILRYACDAWLLTPSVLAVVASQRVNQLMKDLLSSLRSLAFQRTEFKACHFSSSDLTCALRVHRLLTVPQRVLRDIYECILQSKSHRGLLLLTVCTGLPKAALTLAADTSLAALGPRSDWAFALESLFPGIPL